MEHTFGALHQKNFPSPDGLADVYLNQISTAVPKHNAHDTFVSFIPSLTRNERSARLIGRLASKSQIERRFSVLTPSTKVDRMDEEEFFVPGAFASTARRMEKYKKEALPLAIQAISPLFLNLGAKSVTHLIITSCTGFYAPGLDLDIQKHFKMRSSLERTVIGFMGCYAAFNALKTARHIVRSDSQAKVLVVNLELCTLHLQEESEPEKILGYLQFADGCAASVISAESKGLKLERFHTEVLGDHSDLIQWRVGDQGFEMVLSMDVPKVLASELPNALPKLLSGQERAETVLWAIHPGGRSILDSVQLKLELTDQEMLASRNVLKNFGNMSSATIMFVLQSLLEDSTQNGIGMALAFGPGLTVESMRFHKTKMSNLA